MATGSRWHARRFCADPADLDVAFSDPPPSLGTTLLARCMQDEDGARLPAAEAWRWTICERLQALLAIAEATHGPALEAVCACADCGARIALDLQVPTFRQPASAQVEWRDASGHRLWARLPNGEDLRAWAEEDGCDVATLASRLVSAANGATDVRLSRADLDALAEALDAADPLTALTLDVACPECGAVAPVAVDLERLVLDVLHRRQRAAIDDVHRLARAYHWREADILALPEARRRAYLDRLEAESA
jgi:hypothetical protein